MDEKDLNSLFLRKRWSHHTLSGGYDQICRYIEGSSITVNRKKDSPFTSFKARLKKKLFPSTYYTNFYSGQDFVAELKVMRRVKKNNISVVHSIYAEDQLNFLLYRRNWLLSALVGSFHLPEDSGFMKRVIKAGYEKKYKKIDAAIVMSRSMLPFVENLVGENRAFYIPHGIDTDMFSPAENNHLEKHVKNLKVLTVGSHGRDWDTYERVISEVSRSKLSIDFISVLPEELQSRFQKFSNLRLLSQISESDLISLYRSSDLLYMPVNFSTANNSVLEALACGVPVLTTRVGGIPDYVDENCGWLVQNKDVSETVNILKKLTENRNRLLSFNSSARNKSLEFSWERVAEKTKSVYKIAFEHYSSNRG